MMTGRFILSGRGGGRGEAIVDPIPERIFRMLLVDDDLVNLLSLGIRIGMPRTVAGWSVMM